MELMNELQALEPQLSGAALAEILEKLVLLLAPFVPYLAQELWEELGHSGPVFRQAWPGYDPELAREEEAEVVVQVNGKVRGHILVPFGAPRQELERKALENDKVQNFLKGKQVVKFITVPDRLVNIVVKG
jgi:leucyl-tRNA synthetase